MQGSGSLGTKRKQTFKSSAKQTNGVQKEYLFKQTIHNEEDEKKLSGGAIKPKLIQLPIRVESENSENQIEQDVRGQEAQEKHETNNIT
ncbi:hypothetical protein OXYTRIMIC_787 [Oxytricha trifallax]|uniref:Uncharacterized protein n=1 Tax=Oxytricha trifallax TaxID=1172189 RepID=A0A073I0R4_9SPIT|nr:hypothetical protein OXYTRIMIC_787 [Oxytricha trifallax]